MGAKYLVFQEEMGEQGNHHFQGYIEMPKTVRFSHFREWMDGAHFKPAKGTSDDNEKYCTKVDDPTYLDGPWRYGVRSQGQGSRTDLLALRDAVKGGKRGRELFDDDEIASQAIKYGRGVESMVRAYSTALPRDDIRVVFHFGPPGTGKTWCCHQPNAYMAKIVNGFWLNYKGESHVVLDEFGGHVMSPLELQTLCDRYPYNVNIKGGEVAANVGLRSMLTISLLFFLIDYSGGYN